MRCLEPYLSRCVAGAGPPHQHPAYPAPQPRTRPEPTAVPQGQGQGHRSRKKTVTIPSGSTLAFQVAQLLIDSDWGELGLGCVLVPRLHGGEAGKPREGCRLAGDAGGATGVRPHSLLGG